MSFQNPKSGSADADLVKRIGIAFTSRPRIAWHDFHVSANEGVVTLRGAVPSIYDRQLIVAVTRHVAGVFGVDDQLTVAEADAQQTAKSKPRPEAPRAARQSSDVRRLASRNGRHFLRPCLATLALAALVLTGCGESADPNRVAVYPVSGAIQFRGQPAVGAFVTLHPKDGQPTKAPAPRATVGPGGNFTLTTYDGNDGAPEGEYTLTVQWYRPVRQGDEFVGGPNVLPPKYALANTSDIKIRVAAGENLLQPIQIR
jgi:hypothetical protein